MTCIRGHSFDIARSGYVNLLQPQDRKSRAPGDSAGVVSSRRRLHDLGITAPLARAVGDMVELRANDSVLDAGCGEGFYLVTIAQASGARGSGVDISVPAIDAAARRYPEYEWVIANADRLVPWQDRSFSVLLSITGRLNPGEFHRVLRQDGRLLIALSSPDDLIELRGLGRDRTERTIADFDARFRLEKRCRVTTTADLDADAVAAVLAAIYRPLRAEPPRAMHLTFGFDLLLFRAR